MINIKTICKLIEETSKLTNDKVILSNLLEIKHKSEKMEDRLLKYCNSIESLGFAKVNRNYDKQ